MLLFLSVLLIVAVLSTKLSSKFGLPLLIGFTLIGMVAGSDVLNLIWFDDALLTKRIADVLLVFIIFEGGFRVTRESFRSVAGPSLTLATLGVALTSAILGLFIHLILKFDLVYSFIISSIISSTDAAGVFMITKANPIRSRLATTLNVESAANDPMAILLTVAFIQLQSNALGSPAMAVLRLVWQFAGGAAAGFAGCCLTVVVLERLKSDTRGNYNVLVLGCILFVYGIADLAGANGMIAVFFMGYRLGNSRFPAKQSVSNLLETVSTVFNIALFIMLGLLAFPSQFAGIWKEALLVVVVMMFVARPVAVFLSTLPFGYSAKEKLFLMWGGIKGAVPIVLATYPAAYGLDRDGFVFDTILFAVLVSCVLQGTTLGPLSRWLGLTDRKKPESPYRVELHTTRASDIEMYEVEIGHGAPSIGVAISRLELGKDVLISSIIRDDKLILPSGDTAIRENDLLYVLAHSSRIGEVISKLNA